MNTGKRRTIRKKVAQLILAVSLATVLLLGLATGVGLVNIRQDTVDSLGELNSQTSEDATGTLREQLQEELVTLVENRGAQADTSLELILNQTRLVAMAAQDIYSEPEQYLEGLSPDELSFDAYDLSCNYPEEVLGSFSFHIRIPRSIMAEDSIVEEDGTVVSAQLDLGALTQEQRTEYYLTKYLKGVLGGIRNFDNGDGTYTGIGASYFCLESSGIDVLADTLTMDMVEYDARESTWYTEASKLPEGGIYWTNPTPDASGRGLSLICAMPVYVDGELVGVAGSGGDINNIRELVQGTTIGETGYAVLVNTAVEGRLNIIASADTDETSELNSCHDDLFKTGNAELLAVLESTKFSAEEQAVVAEILKRRKDMSKKTMWMYGGDGWAYDIGYGGLDHVFAMGEDVNVLLVDTEVYSNTGGQSSKATPVGAVAQFQASGKKTKKKDLGMLMMTYDNVYVAQCSMGADPAQLIKAIREAEAHKGPSIVICYAPCINHGIKKGMGCVQQEMKDAVASGYWNLYRYSPETHKFTLDSKEPSMALYDFMKGEVRYSSLELSFPENAKVLFAEAEDAAKAKYESYKRRAEDQ